jgi:hypothetical protein
LEEHVTDRLIHLRCSVLMDDEEAYVSLPVERFLWEDMDEVAREGLRDQARRELQGFVHRETGRLLTSDELAAAVVTVEEPVDTTAMDAGPCEVEFVGGPADGTRMAVSGNPPPPLITLPVEQPLTLLLDDVEPMESSLRTANYGPILDEHWACSRTDDGTWRYGIKR